MTNEEQTRGNGQMEDECVYREKDRCEESVTVFTWVRSRRLIMKKKKKQKLGTVEKTEPVHVKYKTISFLVLKK